tara:strand:+ start:1058 stop:1276 length:219 start_codon:yes stop_codon:yes gene_type:complete
MPALPEDKGQYTVAEIADHIGVSKSMVRRFIHAGRLACYDTGGKFVAHREDVEQLLQDLRVPRREPVVRLQE